MLPARAGRRPSRAPRRSAGRSAQRHPAPRALMRRRSSSVDGAGRRRRGGPAGDRIARQSLVFRNVIHHAACGRDSGCALVREIGHRLRRSWIVDECQRDQRLRARLGGEPRDAARARQRRRSRRPGAAARRSPRMRASHSSGSARPSDEQQRGIDASSCPAAAMPSASRYQRSAPSNPRGQLQTDVAASARTARPAATSATSRRTAGAGIGRQPPRLGEHRRLRLAQRAERGDADLRIRIVRAGARLRGRRPGPSSREQPDRTRAMERVGVREDASSPPAATPAPPAFSRSNPLPADVDGRTEQRLDLTRGRRQIDRRRCRAPGPWA